VFQEFGESAWGGDYKVRQVFNFLQLLGLTHAPTHHAAFHADGFAYGFNVGLDLEAQFTGGHNDETAEWFGVVRKLVQNRHGICDGFA